MKSLLTALLLFCSLAHAEIRDIRSFTDAGVASEIAASPDTTWVIFDIDNTLLHPTTMMGSHQWGDYMRDTYLALGASKEVATKFQLKAFGAVQDVTPTAITEDAVFRLLETFKARQIPVFALTARPDVIVPITLKQISKLGFNFEPTFPALTAKDASVHRGVVFSGETPKGILLKRLISEAKVKPTKILFFDDKRYNLESVEGELASVGVQLVGFRYGYLDSEVAGFKPDIANIEWLHFRRTKRGLSDRAAQEMLFAN